MSGEHDHQELATDVYAQTLAARITALEGRVAALETEPPPDPLPPTPPPVVTGVYGPGIAGDTLSNSTTNDNPAYKFTFGRTGDVTGFRVYFEIGSGYSAGNGGSRRITLETDAGGFPSGTVLGSATHSGLPTKAGLSRWPLIPITYKVTDPNALFHLLMTNANSTDYISANGMIEWLSDAIGQPALPGWGITRIEGGKRVDRTPHHIPVMDILWADGTVTGNGYVNAFEVHHTLVSGSNRARCRFTPTRDITFSEILVRAKRTATGSGSLTVSVGGASGSIPVSSFPQFTVADGVKSNPNGNKWGRIAVPTTTLKAGVAQTIELSGPSTASIAMQSLQKGNAYGLLASFKDGYSEHSTDGGSTWRGVEGWSGPDTGYDLMWCLR